MTTSETPQRQEIRKEADRLREDALYTFKGHYDAEAYWQKWHFGLGIPATALGVGAGSTVARLPWWVPALLAFAAAGLTAALTVVNPSDRARKSRAAADAIHAHHDRLRRWAAIDLPSLTDTAARDALESFAADKERLNKAAPPIPQAARLHARQGIEDGEAKHLVDG
jgi:hypothetical protein